MNELMLLAQRIEDAPLTMKNKVFFVNRERELGILNNLARFSPGGIFGVASETGMGKTTLFNLFGTAGNKNKKFIISITEKDSKKNIVADLIYKFASLLERENKLHDLASSAKRFIIEEINSETSVSVGGNFVVSGTLTRGKSKAQRFNIYSLKERLKELLSNVLDLYERCVIVIDEIDKEKKEDVVVILDSLKDVLNVEGLVVIFALPFVIYREYIKDRLHKGEFGNLENILKEMVFLEPMTQSQIEEIIWKRIKGFEELVEEEAVKTAARFSDGNPREALWALNRAIFRQKVSSSSTVKITKTMILDGIKDFSEEALAEAKLSEQQLKAVKSLKDYEGRRNEIINYLKSNGFAHSTAYDIVARLEEKAILIRGKMGYRISGKFSSVLSE